MVTVESIGKSVRSRRRNLDWSQDELARRAGLSISCIWNVEKGRYALTIQNLVKIAAALGVDPIELMRGEVR